jgi:hypothetical protein
MDVKRPHPRPLSQLPPPSPRERGEKQDNGNKQKVSLAGLPSPGGGVGGAGRGAGVRAWAAVVLLLMTLVVARPARADDTIPSEVRLPLKDYLSLVETAERIDRERAEELAHREAPVAEVVSQRVSLTVGDDEIAVVSDFEVLLQGKALTPVFLPVAGFPETVEIRDEAGRTGAAAVTAAETGGGVLLAAMQAGRYTIHVTGRAELGTGGGTGRVALGKVAAPVASTEVDLPAELSWSSPGAVVVEERELNGRRRVRLATTRGAATVLNVRRKVDSAEAEKLLAQSVVLTIVQLRPEGLRRHDVVLYEVKRGGLGRFTVELPPGLEIEQAATDEGTVEPVVENGRLTVHRRHQLQGVGYLVLTSRPPALEALPADGLSLEAVKPLPEVRARYLAVSLAVAADVHPLPAASWVRVDTSDLPALLSDALTALDLAAAWRLATETKDARLAVAPLPPAPLRDAVVRRRDTIALLTVDGTLLFRDRFLVDARSRAGAALDVTLPAGGKLWSVKVDEQAVRPLDRGGVLSVPLGFNSGTRTEVEVVSVQERVLPPGRSQLALDLPQVSAPVLVQHLRLLLPEGASYRFRRSELRYAPEIPEGSAFMDRSNVGGVGGNESGQTASFAGSLQSGTANLHVKVVDEKGHPLPGSTVTMRGALGSRVAVTNGNGVAILNGPGGIYSLTAEHEGFSDREFPNVELPNGRSPGLLVTLSQAVEDVITINEANLVANGWQLDGVVITDMAALESSSTDRFKKEIAGLQQGLVGGVKPLPVSIPETGKALVFSGVLPPAHVTVELDVKGKAKS